MFSFLAWFCSLPWAAKLLFLCLRFDVTNAMSLKRSKEGKYNFRLTSVAQKCLCLKGQYHAIFSNILKIERRYSVDSSQDIMTRIPLKYYQNAKKLSTDVFAGR